jgi:hypothetical protein
MSAGRFLVIVLVFAIADKQAERIRHAAAAWR